MGSSTVTKIIVSFKECELLRIYFLGNTYRNEGEFVVSATLKPVLSIQLKYECEYKE
jgi:hypothetical protein